MLTPFSMLLRRDQAAQLAPRNTSEAHAACWGAGGGEASVAAFLPCFRSMRIRSCISLQACVRAEPRRAQCCGQLRQDVVGAPWRCQHPPCPGPGG